ncbi:MAG: TraR/DksA C4-type zinc finger protein [Gemmatimonadota bacterium]
MLDSHLSPSQLEELQTELLQALTKLERSMATTDEASRPVTLDQTAVGRLSRMDSIQNQALTSNLKDRERDRLGAILAALKRMEQGEFGRCTDCGGEISFPRLMVFPETPTCQSCA